MKIKWLQVIEAVRVDQAQINTFNGEQFTLEVDVEKRIVKISKARSSDTTVVPFENLKYVIIEKSDGDIGASNSGTKATGRGNPSA